MTEAALDTRIDKNVLALEIIKECGAQTPRYMDTSFFAIMAINFFKVKAREIVRDLDALMAEYNGLEAFNVERRYDGEVETEYGKTTTRTDNLQRKFAQGDITAQHSVSADNETGLAMRDQNFTTTADDFTNDTGTQTHADSGADTVTDGHTETEKGRRTPAQELLLSELEANKANIYHIIALDFSDNLMCAIY